jgi:glycosyltransferase involved in cell wall biosynthesis
VRQGDNRAVDEPARDPAAGAGQPPPVGLAALSRGAAVVCVQAGEGALGPAAQTVRSVRESSAGAIQVVLYGRQAQLAACQFRNPGADRSPEDRAGGLIPVAASLTEAARAVAPADLVVVEPGCLVHGDWLARMRAAAYASPEVATASALALAGATGETVGESASPPPGRERPRGELAEVPPRLSAPRGPCVYIRRSAIELVGDPDQAGFAERCERHALLHVLVPDARVLAPACAAPSDAQTSPARGPERWARARARRAAHGLTVAIDARELQRPPDGTRVHLMALIAALGSLAAERGDLRITVIVGPSPCEELLAHVRRLPGVALASMSRQGRPPDGQAADVVHRPHQLSTPADLAVLGALGERLVITQQDLISFQRPGYFRSEDDWCGYRQLTRRALAVADRVVFFSKHACREALAEGLLEPSRASVVAIGVDHVRAGDGAVEAPGAPVAGEELVVCLGTDLAHKNRPFALRVAAALQTQHGWRGRLVLAGAHVELGSSREEEHALLSADPALREAVLDLGPVGEAQKRWLLSHAGVVLYPTLHEGFGLIPFEAAAHGVPCLWAPGTALEELLGQPPVPIVPWDAPAAARSAAVLMRDPDARRRAIAAVCDRGRELTWERTAAALLDVYRLACEDPPAPAGVLERDGGLMGSGLSEDAVRLVGPGGALPTELERPLLALATHPRVGRPVFGAIRIAHALARDRARRRGGRP